MADATEDDLTVALADDSDAESDAVPDFVDLGLNSSAKSSSSIPKRGLKDFEPNATLLQSDSLAASRSAMHEALSYTRTHNPNAAGMGGKTIIGVYDTQSGLTKVDRSRAKGSMWRTIGKVVSGGDIELLPEEALYSLEAGRLDVRYSTVDDEADSTSCNDSFRTSTVDGDSDEFGLAMSLQGAYAAYISESNCDVRSLTIERYQVYSGLKRAGYNVFRSPEGWSTTRKSNEEGSAAANVPKNPASGVGMFQWLYGLLQSLTQESQRAMHFRQSTGPLVKPGLYRGYDEIYRLLHIIPTRSIPTALQPDDFNLESSEPNEMSPFTTTYNVYKPHPNFRKSSPGAPDFRICVVSARDSTVPSLREVSCLMNEQAYAGRTGMNSEPGSGNVGNMYGRLKNGLRNVIFAIVDEGIVSYIRIAETAFSQERLYDRAPRSGGGGKRGGRGGKRGRGK